jgi:uncharacterized membrane protein YccF (DUF307 family)
MHVSPLFSSGHATDLGITSYLSGVAASKTYSPHIMSTAEGDRTVQTVGNILWLLLAGLWLALGYLVAGVINLVFIITIPFAIQSFKLSGFALWPFGRVVVERTDSDAALSLIGNVIWFIFSGFWLALAHAIVGLIFFITIVGIPFGVANFKMARLALAPFGKQIVRAKDVRPTDRVVIATPSLSK